MPDTNDSLRAVVDRIPRIIGAALGTAVGIQMGDPVTGAAVGEAMSQVGDDFLHRVLSTRQEERVATVLELAAEEVARRLESGHTVRADGMFDGPTTDAVEITEGVLLVARDEHQAKKLPYMANLYASIALSDAITLDAANVAIRDAEQLSWSEMCLLAMVQRPDEFPLPETEVNRAGSDWADWAISHSFHQLLAEDGYLYSPAGEMLENIPFRSTDLRMSGVKLTPRGVLISGLMGLERIPSTEIAKVYPLLLRAAEAHVSRQAAEEASGDEPSATI